MSTPENQQDNKANASSQENNAAAGGTGTVADPAIVAAVAQSNAAAVDAAKTGADTGSAEGQQQSDSSGAAGEGTGDKSGTAADAPAAGASGVAANVGQGQEPDVAEKEETTLTQQAKVVPAPQSVSGGVKDTSLKTTAAVTQTAEKPVENGVVVKSSGIIPVAQLQEVQDAMKVAKAKTQSALNSILEYVDKMDPAKPQSQASIEANQIQLRASLYTVLSAEDENFDIVYKGLLAIVRANAQKCFKITARNRGLNTVTIASLDNKGMRFLTRVLDLLVLTAGTNNLELVKKNYELKRLFEVTGSVRINDNLTAYYSV